MSLQVALFPAFHVPNATLERVPALRRVRARLRRRFDLRVFDWALTAERPRQPEDLVQAIAADISTDVCVIAEAPAMPLLLSAMDHARTTPRAIVAIGMAVTGGTLRSLGLSDVVRADRTLTEAAGRLRQYLDFLRRLVGDDATVEALERSVPWNKVFEIEDWVDDLNLLSLGPFTGVPALLFSSSRFPLLAEGEMEQVFRRLFPGGREAHLERYPFGLDDPSVGDELVDQLIPFIESLPIERPSKQS